jgi:NTP pyrophosphatase (non-canonical NTP hydrolase)
MKSAGQLATPNDQEACNLQMVFIEEEFYELLHAYNNLGREDIIKEACDVIWVTYGLLHSMGVNVDEAFDRVSESNNSKLPFTFKNGKVQKGPNYKKPDLKVL